MSSLLLRKCLASSFGTIKFAMMVTYRAGLLDQYAWSESDFVGGHPFLNFLNTVADTDKSRDEDKIPDWRNVRAWASQSGLLSSMELEHFLANQKLDGVRELADLHHFREDAYQAVSNVIGIKPSRSNAMDSTRMRISSAFTRGRFERSDYGFAWRANPKMRERWADALALSLNALLCSDDLRRVRQCARCTWFFIDRGRGVGRRWCDMRTCGNRAKIAAFRCN